MADTKYNLHLEALENFILDDLVEASTEEIAREANEDGINISAEAERIRVKLRESVAALLRERLESAKREERTPQILPMPGPFNLAPAKIKSLIEEAFQVNPSLKAAYRLGKKTTAEDDKSILEDLISLGAIKLDNTHD